MTEADTNNTSKDSPVRNGASKTTTDAVGEWHVIDAANQPLGRIATHVASLLLGKHRPDAVPHQTAPVFVVVTSTDQVALTGTKETDKVYSRYSGYPGGLRQRTVAEQRSRDSRQLVYLAVRGMLPKNKLRDQRLQHLKLYAGAKHPHQPQTHNG